MDLTQYPFLRSGIGASPAEGGCVMQVTDWIHSGGWSDSPRCVNNTLRVYAIHVNDSVHETTRQRLIDLVPRLIGTSRYRLDPGQEEQLYTAYHSGTAYHDGCAPADGFVTCHISSSNGFLLQCDCGRLVDGLIALLDKFDEITGHKAASEPDYAELCELVPETVSR